MPSGELITRLEPFNGPRKADAETLIRKVADTLHRLNHQIAIAVDAGVTIELMRGSRCHNGEGQWGDQLVPIVKLGGPPRDAGE